MTDNKLRWQTNIKGAPFEIYIHKWRVPHPWPGRIIVQIENDFERGKPWLDEMSQQASTDLDPKEPIIAVVERFSQHSRTVRFAAEGSSGLGGPGFKDFPGIYIPNELLEGEKS